MGKARQGDRMRETAQPIKVWRALVRVATLAGALLSGTLLNGCMPDVHALYGPLPAYGVFPPPDDSPVYITDFSYTPASPILAGDRLTFSLKLNKPVNAGTAAVYIADGSAEVHVTLFDDGEGPDGAAGDGTYTGSVVWQKAPKEVITLPVEAEVGLNNGAPSLHADGPPLTVLPNEEGGS